MNSAITYRFEPITNCEMCGSKTATHKVLGQRLNSSQGMRPKKKDGISVSIKKCTDCGLIYSSPLPVPQNVQDHYGIPPEEYWKPSYFEWHPDYFLSEITTVKKLFPFTPGLKALDIGAGIGKCMISLSKAGFDTYGFEPSVPFYERALSKMQIDPQRLKLGMMEEVEYEKNLFDFITFGAVMEHLYHPAQCLEKSLQWLKPGGIIHIEVPSSDYFISKLINFYYRLIGTNYVTHVSPMHDPFHLYEFSLGSFQKLAHKLNYTLAFHQYHVGEIEFFPKALHPILKTYMQQTGKGMQLTVWLKKNH